jgi:hypothetical protein
MGNAENGDPDEDTDKVRFSPGGADNDASEDAERENEGMGRGRAAEAGAEAEAERSGLLAGAWCG